MQKIKKTICGIYHTIGRFFYPPLCPHCNELLEVDEQLLCHVCTSQLELLDTSTCCTSCFSEEVDAEKKVCKRCTDKEKRFQGLAAVFDHIGPAATLVHLLKNENCPYLAQGMAGYLATQFLRMDWPLPEIIVAVPMAYSRFFQVGFNPSQLLAKHLGEILGVRCSLALGRKSGDYRQQLLAKEDRDRLTAKRFYLKRQVEGKTVLVIDDLMLSGMTMLRCAETLFKGKPKQIYGLTFSCSMK